MENVFSPAVTDSVESAAKDSQKLGQDVKGELNAAVSRGRDIAEHLASVARTAAVELSERAKEALSEGRNRASKAVGRVSDYADDNTALVALAAFGAGLLVGYLTTRRSGRRARDPSIPFNGNRNRFRGSSRRPRSD